MEIKGMSPHEYLMKMITMTPEQYFEWQDNKKILSAFTDGQLIEMILISNKVILDKIKIIEELKEKIEEVKI